MNKILNKFYFILKIQFINYNFILNIKDIYINLNGFLAIKINIKD